MVFRLQSPEAIAIMKENTRDITTNPPYKYAQEFIEHGLEISPNGTKIAMLLKVQFLEGQSRLKLFRQSPPKYIYVFSKRVLCAKNGDFQKMIDGGGSAIAYAWFVWVKGNKDEPVIRWIGEEEEKQPNKKELW